MRKKALIFDMDGVIIDSEGIHLRALYEFLRSLKPELRLEELYQVVGRSREDVWSRIQRAVETDLPWEELHRIYKEEWTPVHPKELDYRSIYRPETGEMLARARNSDNDPAENPQNASPIEYAIEHTASRMDFHGRWERLCTSPDVIADIGHNAHGLKYNFAQIEHLLDAGEYSDIIIIYGIVADKDLDAVFPLMPKNANYIFTNASGKRALPASELLERYLSFMSASENGTERKTDAAPASSVRHLNARTAVNAESAETVSDAVAKAFALAGKFVASDPESKPLIYIGGSTFIVSEAISAIKNRK